MHMQMPPDDAPLFHVDRVERVLRQAVNGEGREFAAATRLCDMALRIKPTEERLAALDAILTALVRVVWDAARAELVSHA